MVKGSDGKKTREPFVVVKMLDSRGKVDKQIKDVPIRNGVIDKTRLPKGRAFEVVAFKKK